MNALAKRSQQESLATPYKQFHLEYLLSILFPVWQGMRYRHSWFTEPLLYVDLHAGSGHAEDGSPGSPIVFAKMARITGLETGKINAYFYERNPTEFEMLQTCPELKPYTLLNEDNRGIYKILPRRQDTRRYGLVYGDPPGGCPLHEIVPLYVAFSRMYKHVDLLLNFPATAWKRQARTDHYQYMTKMFKRIERERVLIRAPYRAWHWTMLLFTNWLDFPDNENAQWYDIDSEAGQYYWNLMGYPAGERNDSLNQPELFK